MSSLQTIAASVLLMCGAAQAADSRGGPINDDCTSALPVSCGRSVIMNSVGASADVTDPTFPCTEWGDWQGRHTLWFTFQAATPAANISLCNPGTLVQDPLLAVYSGHCGNFTQVACSDDAGEGCGPFGQLPRVSVDDLVPGQTYYIQVAGWDDAQAGQLELTIECSSDACDCPAGALGEGESNCGLPTDHFNGGCNSTPPVFSSIECGQTVCGTVSSDGAFRDTDWYQVVTTNTTTLALTVTAGFSGFFGLIDNDGTGECGEAPFISSSAPISGDCSPVTLAVLNLPPGTWWWVVAPDYAPVPCARPEARYTATFSGTACNRPMDECADAAEIEFGSSVTFDNTPLTDGPQDPAFSCHFGGPSPGYRTAWFTFVATDTSATVSTNPGTTVEDTLLALYSGGCGVLTEIACNDDGFVPACGLIGFRSKLVADGLTPGRTYVIQVAALSAFPWDIGTIEVSVTGSEPTSDCNANGFDDTIDIKTGVSLDAFNAAAKPGIAGGPDTIPDECQCVADWNRDGISNSTDVSEFINTYFADQAASAINADINGDGVSNSTDVSDFINLWFSAQAGQLPFGGCVI